MVQMGENHFFQKEKLVLGALYSSDMGDKERAETEDLFQSAWGPWDYRSDDISFNFTDYYEEEMGPNLLRRFYSFQQLRSPEELAAIKVFTNSWESERFFPGGGRRVNLDPGFLSLGRLMLATTKNRAHRIPLSQGIYAEVTLMYQGKAFQALPWTYPDFRDPGYQEILLEIRRLYREQLRSVGSGSEL